MQSSGYFLLTKFDGKSLGLIRSGPSKGSINIVAGAERLDPGPDSRCIVAQNLHSNFIPTEPSSSTLYYLLHRSAMPAGLDGFSDCSLAQSVRINWFVFTSIS